MCKGGTAHEPALIRRWRREWHRFCETDVSAASAGEGPVRVLVIEDDRKVASFIEAGLEQEGYAVDVLHDGSAAGPQVGTVDYDAVVLDLMLPGRSGFQILREIRAEKASLPVLILTAKDSLEDRVTGLDAGADDYMGKPFALAEVSARLRALLRRGAPGQSVLHVADLEMDTIRRTVRRAGSSIDLTPKEYALLEYLMRNSHRPLTRTLIIAHVWDMHFDSISNIVEYHINSLRNKIDRGFEPPLIHTIRGVGYVLTDTGSPLSSI
jgi:two-component system, OmpR family, copper resistance phosphate regulon response regulator CusR